MVRQPIVSVIVPSYNKPEYLPECLESIRAQTFTDWECIVVSDGSPRMEEIRAAVAAMGDDRFRLVEHRENRGLAAARNTGIREARAELVICVDEDDRLNPGCLSTLLRHMGEGNTGIVCPQGRFFGGSSGKRPCHVPSLEEVLLRQPLLLAGSLIRRGVFREVGLYDEHPLIKVGREDHEWWIRVVKAKVPIMTCEEELYYIRRAETSDDLRGSLDFSASRKEHAIYKYITEKHQDVYGQWPGQRRSVLRQAWLREAHYYKVGGKKVGALWRIYLAACVSRQGKDWKAALRGTMDLALGRDRSEALRRWRQRFKH